ncbi:hypothetical protein [Streptomyces sp. NPDC001500]
MSDTLLIALYALPAPARPGYTAGTHHRPPTEPQRRGYLLRQYDELPELPAPQ